MGNSVIQSLFPTEEERKIIVQKEYDEKISDYILGRCYYSIEKSVTLPITVISWTSANNNIKTIIERNLTEKGYSCSVEIISYTTIDDPIRNYQLTGQYNPHMLVLPHVNVTINTSDN